MTGRDSVSTVTGRGARGSTSLRPAVVAFLAVAAAALIAACWLPLAGSARADQSCGRQCRAVAAQQADHRVPRTTAQTDPVATPSYADVAAIGLGALGLVLAVGGGLLLAAGRRRSPIHA